MSNTFTADLDTLPTLENPTIFEPTQADDIRAHLAEQGYALIKAMEPHEARTYYSEFWAWLEDLGTGLKRGDPSTWDLRTSWPDQVHGMITSYGIGQAAFMWKSRTSPGVLSVFREIWYAKSDEDLITSFDGASMYPGRELPFEEDDGEMEGSPKSAKPLRMTLRSPFARDGEYKLWPHRDQAPTKGSMISVQGLVNLASNEGKHDGGFVVWPGSHLIDWPTKYPGMNGSSSGLFMIPNGTPEMDPSLSVTLRAPAGTLMIWDSRTIHCNRPPTSEGYTRAVAYICMLPRKQATPEILRKRCKYYETWRTTSHWPTPVYVISDAKGWRSRNTVDAALVVGERKTQEKPWGEGERLVRRLVGYDE